jgi:hypothetical protein
MAGLTRTYPNSINQDRPAKGQKNSSEFYGSSIANRLQPSCSDVETISQTHGCDEKKMPF